ncbi:MAG: CBS domain-containing protein [Euryarchaeota archaeon]|nr:CBS domain-containing protein [Euryarchaeota archaeon]
MVLKAQQNIDDEISFREMDSEIAVRDIMTKKVYILDAACSVLEVAQEMVLRNAGSIIITKGDKATGIITEKDTVSKVTAKDTIPSTVTAEEIMSSPIITTEPDTSVIEASELMVRSGIRRLAVLDDGDIVGLITDRDVLTISPGLHTILRDLIEMNHEQDLFKTGDIDGGICQRCGAYVADLTQVNGLMLCEDCKDDEGYYD